MGKWSAAARARVELRRRTVNEEAALERLIEQYQEAYADPQRRGWIAERLLLWAKGRVR